MGPPVFSRRPFFPSSPSGLTRGPLSVAAISPAHAVRLPSGPRVEPEGDEADGLSGVSGVGVYA